MKARHIDMGKKKQASVVLVVDGEKNQLETIGRGLYLTGYEAVCFAKQEDALALLESSIGTVVQGLVADIAEEGSRDHMSLLESARKIRGELKLVAIVDERCHEETERLRELGVEVIYKPFSVLELNAAIDRALEKEKVGAKQ